MKRFDYLSDRLRDTRNRIAEHRHGGVVMSSEEVELLVKRLDGYAEMAFAMETQLNDMQLLNSAELNKLVPPASATILHLMRPGTNVVPFPRSPHSS